jgi:hypothetical protein
MRYGCGGCFVRLLLGPIVLIAGVLLAMWWDATHVAPWAYGKGPLLTGVWVGQFQTPSGALGAMELHVARSMQTHGRGSQPNRARIQVGARVCSPAFGVKYIQLVGTANTKGDTILLKASVDDRRSAAIGMGAMHGTWMGDSLQVTTTLTTPKNKNGPDTTTVVLTHQRPDTFYDDCRQDWPTARTADPPSAPRSAPSP